MGRDKAFVTLDGVALAEHARRALRAAGAREIFAIGGDVQGLEAVGFTAVPDEVPLEGPLGGILTALRAASEETIVILACDMPWVESQHVTRLVASLDDLDVVLSAASGRVEPLLAAWSRAARHRIEELFTAGERSPLRAAGYLRSSVLELGGGSWSRDLDTPTDLANAPMRGRQ